MNPPPFVKCRWCKKRLVRQALRAHQARRCPVRALRHQVHATARDLGLELRGQSELARIVEELSERRPEQLEYEELDEAGCRRKRAL